MTISPHSGALAAARDLMDRANAAPNGVRITFLTGPQWGDLLACQAHAKRLQQSIHQARTAQRRINAKVFTKTPDRQEDTLVIAEGGTGTGTKGNDPDAARTEYDNLTTFVEPVTGEPQPADPANGLPEPSTPIIGWSVVIRKPNLSALSIDEF